MQMAASWRLRFFFAPSLLTSLTAFRAARSAAFVASTAATWSPHYLLPGSRQSTYAGAPADGPA